MFRISIFLLAAQLLLGQAYGCTAFQVKAEDGALLYCRTLEFGIKLDSDLLIVPRGIPFTGTSPGNVPGLKWNVKYGYVGMNQSVDRLSVSDGMNEKGLVVGILYLPGFAKFEPYDESRKERTLGSWEMGSFLLGTCATVEEVQAVLPTILVAQQPVPEVPIVLPKNFVLPVHFYVCDASGAILVVEYIDGKRHEYKNPLGVLTNSPPFGWHLANLATSINLSPVNVQELSLRDWKIRNLGQGSGLLGLRGDYTSPSRFVRAALFSQWATSPKTAKEAVRTGLHILNTFDIFEGIVQDHSHLFHLSEITEWVVLHDRTNLKTYFRGYNSMGLQMVDLKKIDFTDSKIRQIDLQKELQVEDSTAHAHPFSE